MHGASDGRDGGLRVEDLTEVFNAVGHPIVILDPEHGIIAANPATAAMLGIPAEQLLGQPCWVAFHGEGYRAPPPACPMERLRADPRVQIVEMEMQTVGGTYLVSCTPVTDAQGRLSRVIHIATDISDRKHAEETERHARVLAEAMARASERYLERGAVSDMAQVIIEQAVKLTGAQMGLVVDWPRPEPPRLLAVSSAGWETLRDDALDREARRQIATQGHFQLPTDRRSLVLEALYSGEPVIANDPLQHPSWTGRVPAGHPTITSFIAVPLRIADEVIGMLALANREGGFDERDKRDLQAFGHTAVLGLRAARSEEQRAGAEEQLHQSQKMEAIGRMAGGVAHDFNNLLAPIIAYSEMALENLPTEHPLRDDMSVVATSAARAAELTQQLLSISRRQLLKLEVLDLGALVTDVVRLLKRILGEDVTIRTRLGHGGRTIRADGGRMHQVLMNLAVNAREAMPDGGTLAISTALHVVEPDAAPLPSDPGIPPGDYVHLQVRDSGVGIRPEDRSRIFEPFFTTKQESQGTGLGLSTVYGIVRQHGGHIWLDSDPGNGTTFHVVLPRVDDRPTPDRSTDELPIDPSRAATILVAEDEPVVRNLLARALQGDGHTVLLAASGEAALNLAREHAGVIDLLLTDVVMPGMDGRQLFARLAEQRPGLRVVYMSGYADDVIAKHGLLDATTPFLAKPFTIDVMRQTVRRALAR